MGLRLSLILMMNYLMVLIYSSQAIILVTNQLLWKFITCDYSHSKPLFPTIALILTQYS